MKQPATDSTLLPADHEQRTSALNPTRSVCVTAPAGSGKTELLSQRVLKLLARVDQPEEILAITFTRKAAGEMHHRILSALQSAAEEPQPDAPHKQLSWQLGREALAQNHTRRWHLLENPSRLKVQTIDSLCASLTRQMPVLSSFGAQPQVTDQPDVLYRQAVKQLMAKLESDSHIASALSLLLIHVDNDYGKVESLLTGLLQRRDQWLLHLGTGHNIAAARTSLEATLNQVVEDLLLQLREQLQPFAGELIPLLDYAGIQIAATDRDSSITQLAGIKSLPLANSDDLLQWQAIVELLITKGRNPGFRKRLDKNCGFPTETLDGDKNRAKQTKQAMTEQLQQLAESSSLLEKLAEFNYLPSRSYSDQQWQLMQGLLIILPMLVAELNLIFQQEGQVDFNAISIAALQSLGDSLNPSELALRLDYQLKHILIDEFQDTSSTQFRLLERLTDGWSEHNANNPGKPNTLFLVGDGMQSIYGFRDANVGLFLEARKYGVNGIKLDDLPLTVNFRSVAQVVSWNNRIFSQAFPAVESLSRGAVPYENAQAFAGESDESIVQMTGFLGEDAPTDEARHLADIIATNLERHPGESIGVLVRSRNHLQELVGELGRRNIPWNANEIDGLKNYSCIVDLLSLVKAMSNLADRISWIALLRCPWFGLTNSDLYWLLAHDSRQSVLSQMQDWQCIANHLSEHAKHRLPVLLAKIKAALQKRQRLSFREWIEGVWFDVGGPAGLRDAREFEMVDRFFNLVDKHESSGRIQSMADFEANIERLYARPQNSDCVLQLMTIHKSKGLEFDTVILPGLGRGPRSDDRALLMWREYLSNSTQSSGLVVSPLPATGQQDAIYEHLRFEQSKSQQLENTRLLYVATTRAIKRLYLTFISELDSKAEQPRTPVANSLLASIWQPAMDEISWQSNNTAGQLGLDLDAESNATKEIPLTRLNAGWQPPEWYFPNPLSDYYLTADYTGENLPQQDDQLASIVGTTVHKVFETITKYGLDFWLERPKTQQTQLLTSLLRHYGLTFKAELDDALVHVFAAIENTLKDSKGRWLLTNNNADNFTELAVSSIYRDKIRHRIVDRVVRDDQGQLWIIDYKTNRPQPDETPAQFLRRCIELYKGQLIDYQWHISRVLNEQAPIKLGLYFTALPLLKEIE